MSIISSEIIEDSPQETGRRRIREKHVDHLGGVHTLMYKCNVGFDANAKLASRAVEIQSNLVEREILGYIKQMDRGIDVNPVITTEFATNNRLLKRLFKHALISRAEKAITLIEVTDSLTDTQIKNKTEFTQARVDKIRARVVNLKQLKIAIANDDLEVEGEED